MIDKLLILDLDETLIHTTDAPLSRPTDLYRAGLYVYVRPLGPRLLRFCM